ncbi:MAG TPA: hypothetical protein VK858_12990 [Longimicrobiales bacterium]|nr:hypothetical protein [Longimicrobiales bacterium]
MRPVPILLLAGLVLTLPPAQLMAQEPLVHEVVITVDDEGQVVFSLDPVVAIPGDRVVFSAPGAESFTIDFPEGTPFQNRTITGTGQQPRNVPIPSGKVREQPYKYDVAVVIGGTTYTRDPEIIVRDRRGR